MVSSKGSDSWDQPFTSPRRTNLVPRRAPAPVVPDDWEEEEEDADEAEEEEVEKVKIDRDKGAGEDTQRIWENANTKAPMPEVVVAHSSTAASVVVPHALAFQPPMRILKRPGAPSSASSSASASASSLSPSPGSDPHSRESLAEREARYQAARERIFGGDGEGGLRNPASTAAAPPPPRPPTVGSIDTKGFTGRRKNPSVVPGRAVVGSPSAPMLPSR